MRCHTAHTRADRQEFYKRRTASAVNLFLQMSILSDSTSGYVLYTKIYFYILIYFYLVSPFHIFLLFRKVGLQLSDYQSQYLS
jgi:hypothetical protein